MLSVLLLAVAHCNVYIILNPPIYIALLINFLDQRPVTALVRTLHRGTVSSNISSPFWKTNRLLVHDTCCLPPIPYWWVKFGFHSNGKTVFV